MSEKRATVFQLTSRDLAYMHASLNGAQQHTTVPAAGWKQVADDLWAATDEQGTHWEVEEWVVHD